MLHAYGEQLVVPLSMHAPRPLHVSAFVDVPAVQDAATHTVPDAWSWHVPVPLQKPFVPQLAAVWAVHSASGSVPTRIGPQLPSVDPAPFLICEHASQSPVHTLSQQTPSTQKLLVHSFAPAHAAPTGFFVPHTPLTHVLPVEQSVSAVHDALHAPPPHV
jgi:hypothetical protein